MLSTPCACLTKRSLIKVSKCNMPLNRSEINNKKEKILTTESYTFVPRARNCSKHPDKSESTYFAATCNIDLFNMHWDASKQVKSSQKV